MVKTVKIFIASSSELVTDRKAFEDYLFQKSKLWLKQKEIFFELVNWEDFLDKMSKTRLQDEYNRAIEGCDIFVMLFYTKVGKYTNEEFETAWNCFQANSKPYIYTYVKDVPVSTPTEPSLKAFLDKLDTLGHFPTHYKTDHEFLLHFSMQLDRLYGGETVVENVAAQMIFKPKEEIMKLINQYDFYTAFEELNKYFLGNNTMLNGLIFEFTSQPNNFNVMLFASRVKTFVNQYYHP